MLADVALGERAIDCIRQRMHAHVGIRVPLELAVMRHRHAAENAGLARLESVHVVALPHADIHGLSHQVLGPREIGGAGDFHVVLVAFDDRHVKPRGARHLDVVGGAAGMAAMRGEDRLVTKPLRRLGAKQPGAVLRAGHQARAAAPQRVGHGEGRGGAGGVGQRVDHPVDHGAAHQRARHVVDQHEARRIARQRLQPGLDARVAGGAAGGDGDIGEALGLAKIVRVEHQHHTVDPRMRQKGGDGPVGDAPPVQRAPLFGQVSARTGAAACGDDDGCDFHAVCLCAAVLEDNGDAGCGVE